MNAVFHLVFYMFMIHYEWLYCFGVYFLVFSSCILYLVFSLLCLYGIAARTHAVYNT